MSLRKTLTMAVTATVLLTADLVQAVENGVASGAAPQVALPNLTNFDPPSRFNQSLPLKGFYLNPNTKMKFTAGNGGVLNSGSCQELGQHDPGPAAADHFLVSCVEGIDENR